MFDRNPYFKFSEKNLKLVQKLIQDSSSILDHGCGDGTWLAFFEDQEKECLGYRMQIYNCDKIECRSRSIIDLDNEIDYLFFVQSELGNYDTWFLSWPPYNKQFANDILDLFMKDPKAKKLLYIGEDEGGCTADSNFFDNLNSLCDQKLITIRYYDVENWNDYLHDRLYFIQKI